MREVLFATCPAALWVMTVIHVVFMVLLFSKYKKTKQKIFILTFDIAFGLFYDAFMF
mgnify:FL=1